MKKILLIFAMFNAALIFTLLGLYYLAVAHPFHPGNFLYGVQSTAEIELIQLTSDPQLRAEMHFDLVERRLGNIATAADDRQIDLALNAYDRCLSEAIRSIQSVPPAQARDWYEQVDQVLVQTDIVLAVLDHRGNSTSLARLEEKIRALQSAASITALQKVVQEESHFPSEIIARVIPFFGKDADHGDFPMDGGHEQVECLECHSEGSYENTPTDCVSCHTLDRDLALVTSRIYTQYLPFGEHNASHYSDACAECHGVDDWTTIDYDHSQVQRCNACHIADIPQVGAALSLPKVFWNTAFKTSSLQLDPSMKHYPGDCSDCHQDTESWKEYTFDHEDTCKPDQGELFYMVGLADSGACLRNQACETCHNDANHNEDYPGSCTNCHNDVENWLNISVDHGTYTSCNQCHSDDSPADHYSGSCSLCHSTATWKSAVNFHDTALNCRSCHKSPEDHSPQQCSICHTTKKWLIASDIKNHGSSNCSSCHNAPAAHYTSNCTDCHNTTDWGTGTYNHDQPIDDCTQCHAQPAGHYPGSCLNCHSTVNWQPVRFDHTGQTNCSACHTAPQEHYTDSCSDCHSTDDWSVGSNVLHTLFSNCVNCHAAPPIHWQNACTDCHSTLRWGVDTGLLHAIYSDCVSCHSTPAGHWPGECANCHNTSSWTEVKFDHSGYTDCKACHERPSSHPRGQCSKCHGTDSWAVEIEATATATDTLMPTPSRTPVPTETPAPSATPMPSDTSVPSEIALSSETDVRCCRS